VRPGNYDNRHLHHDSVGLEVLGVSTLDYLEKWARRGSRRKFERAWRKVADVEPEERDHI
jgi:hypothetical protein